MGGVRAALVVAPIVGEQWETYSIKGITYVGSNMVILDLASPPASPLLKSDPGVPLSKEKICVIKANLAAMHLPEPYA